MPTIAQQDYILVKPKYAFPVNYDWGVLTQLKKAFLSGCIYDLLIQLSIESNAVIAITSRIVSQSGSALYYFSGSSIQNIILGTWSIKYGEAMSEISAQICAERGILQQKVEIFAHESGDKIIAKDNILEKTIACNNHPLYFVLNDSDMVESVQIGEDEIEDALNVSEEYVDGFINYFLDGA